MSEQRIWYIGNSSLKLHKILSALASFLIRPTDDWELVLRPHKRARSSEQNRRYWAILNEIAEYAVHGQKYPADAWHEYFKGRFIGKEEIRLPNGDTLNRPISTTTLDVGQFADYMTQVEAWAAGRGILLGDEVPQVEYRRAA